MLPEVVRKSLNAQRRALTGWAVGLAALVFVEAALWPSMHDRVDLDSLLASYPEALRKLFNIEQLSTGTGFFNAELFSLMLPMLFIIFGIGRGARAIAGEEEAGTLEVVLVTRVTNIGLVLAEAAALALAQIALGVALWVSAYASSLAFGLDLSAGDLAGATLAVVLMGIEFGWLALAAGAVLGRRGAAIAIATAAAVGAYVLYIAAQLVDSMHRWRGLSPFYQALHTGPLGGGFSPTTGWLIVAGGLAVAVALPVFNRRDIGAK